MSSLNRDTRTATPSPDSDGPDAAARLRADRLAFVVKQANRAPVFALVTSLYFVSLMWHYQPHWKLLAWAGGTVGLLLARSFACRFLMRLDTPDSVRTWIGVMLALYAIMMTIQQHPPPLSVYVSMGTLMVQLALLCAWATLFSTYSAPTTAAAFTLAVYVIGHLADDIWTFGSAAESPAVQEVARALYWMLPNFSLLDLRVYAVHERPIPWDRLPASVAYGLAYTGAVLGLAMAVFQRRDLK